MTKLLPCPFCGNDKNIAMANEKHDHSGGYFIACPKCDASTGLRYACGDDPIPLLIEQWNRRAVHEEDGVSEGAIAKVRGMLERMNRKGGLGHDVHGWIGDALDALDGLAPTSPELQESQVTDADYVRDLLWNDHLECCGSPVVGAEYMGQQEKVCCGCPEPALLSDAQIVASLRARFPEVLSLAASGKEAGE